MKRITIAAVLLSLATPVLAAPSDDLAFDVQQLDHDKQSGWVIDRLVTLDISDACWKQVLDKNHAAERKLAGIANYIGRVAKVMTGDDWAHIESQGANNLEANRAIVDKMVTAFAPKFHLTIKLEGKDCDAGGSALWLNYASDAVLSLVKYPPKSGKMTIVVQATSAKGFRAEVNKDGTALAITGSRDIESVGWSATTEKALLRVSSKN